MLRYIVIMKLRNKEVTVAIIGGETMTIGDNIKRIADQRGITIYRIAKDGKISNSYMSEIISNKRKNPSIDIIKKIATVLNVTIDELVS